MEKDIKIHNSFEETPVRDVETGSFEEKTVPTTGFKGWAKNVLLSVETRGIQRVTDEERQKNPTKVWNACTFW